MRNLIEACRTILEQNDEQHPLITSMVNAIGGHPSHLIGAATKSTTPTNQKMGHIGSSGMLHNVNGADRAKIHAHLLNNGFKEVPHDGFTSTTKYSHPDGTKVEAHSMGDYKHSIVVNSAS